MAEVLSHDWIVDLARGDGEPGPYVIGSGSAAATMDDDELLTLKLAARNALADLIRASKADPERIVLRDGRYQPARDGTSGLFPGYAALQRDIAHWTLADPDADEREANDRHRFWHGWATLSRDERRESILDAIGDQPSGPSAIRERVEWPLGLHKWPSGYAVTASEVRRELRALVADGRVTVTRTPRGGATRLLYCAVS